MSTQEEIEKIYGRWRDYAGSVKILQRDLITPLEKLGYSIEVDGTGKPILSFVLPDGARLGSLNTESFYLQQAQHEQLALDSDRVIRATATGNEPSHPRVRINSAPGRQLVLDIAAAFAAHQQA